MGLVAFGAAVVFCSCFHRLSSRPPGEAKPRAGPGRVQEGRDLLTLYGALYGASATPPPTLKGKGGRAGAWPGWGCWMPAWGCRGVRPKCGVLCQQLFSAALITAVLSGGRHSIL